MSYSSEVLADSPLGYWRLGEASGSTAADSSGAGRNGSYAGSPTWGVTGLINDPNTAVQFTADTQWVEISDNAAWDVGQITLEAWVKFTNSASSEEIFLSRWVSGTSIQNQWSLRRTTAGKLQLFWSDNTSTPRSVTGSTTLSAGVRYHLTATITTAGDATVYVNGVADGSDGSFPLDSSSDRAIRIAIYNGTAGGNATRGVIDEVAIYGTALSAGRVLAHYRVGAGFEIAPPTATATAQAHAPTAAFTSGFTVEPPAATATAQAHIPTVSFSSAEDLTIAPPPATATAQAHAPTIQFQQNVTIEPPAATASAEAHAPTFVIANFQDIEVEPPTATASAEAHVPYFEFGVVHTDTSNADDGIFLGDGLAEIVWEPAVVAPPRVIGPQPEAEVRTSATIIDTPPSNFGLPTFTRGESRTEYAPALRQRILIGNKDFSYLNGVPTRIDTVRLIDPLLYGSAQVTIPAINPQYPPAEYADLVAAFKFKRVKVQLVLDGDPAEIVVSDYYDGFVSRVDTEGRELVLQLGGQAAGRLSATYEPPPVYRRRQDIEHVCVDLLRNARVKAKQHDGNAFGIIRRGGADRLTIFNELLGVWRGVTGDLVTFTPNARGQFRKTVKDDAAIHATAYLDESLVSQSLSQDFMEQPNRVYARGETRNGELVANIKTPGLTQGEPPPFPLGDGERIGLGDIDATTDGGVSAVQQMLAIHDFYDYDDDLRGIFTTTLENAVEQFQRFAGLNVTGEVGINTWNRMYSLDQVGYSLDDAREYPTAEDPATRKWNRTANGAKAGLNPLFDPHVQPVEVFIDTGKSGKGETNKYARNALAPEEGVWMGQLTFRSGLFRGEVAPEAVVDSSDVMHRLELRPNMRVWLPRFGGSEGIVVWLTAVEHGPEQTTALCSTHPATTMETWEALARRREAKSNPGRAWSGHVRASQVRSDDVKSWDSSSGWLANKVALAAGWTEVKVPAGQAGIVQRIHMELQSAAPFAAILSPKRLSLTRLDNIDPLADPGDGPEWFEVEPTADWFEARGVLVTWGTFGNPCGYDPGRKSSGGSPTGRFVEIAGFNYETGREPVLFLYPYVASPNHLKGGRILRNQRTVDF